jgi:hypothetical protein
MADLPEVLVDLSQLTIPTPEPFDKSQPERQRENLAYVAMQVLDLFKQAGVQISSRGLDGSISQGLLDLQYEGVVLDLGPIKVIKTHKTGGVLTT